MRKGERKKQDILKVASALFSSRGYVGTSIQDILDALGSSKGSFYHHFKTKFDVLMAITGEQAREARARYLALVPQSPLDALNALLKQAGFLTKENHLLLSSLGSLHDSFEGSALQSVLQECLYREFFELFQAAMDALRKSESAVFTDAALLHPVFLGYLSGCATLRSELVKAGAEEVLPLAAGRLRALRRFLEISLGMMPGSIVILEAGEVSGIPAARAGA